jgi:hypothetical protein
LLSRKPIGMACHHTSLSLFPTHTYIGVLPPCGVLEVYPSLSVIIDVVREVEQTCDKVDRLMSEPLGTRK